MTKIYEGETIDQYTGVKPTELMQGSSNLLFRVPVFLSHPSRLNSIQQEFVDAIISKIREALLFPRTLPVT